jgi:uncharacterized membrane protein
LILDSCATSGHQTQRNVFKIGCCEHLWCIYRIYLGLIFIAGNKNSNTLSCCSKVQKFEQLWDSANMSKQICRLLRKYGCGNNVFFRFVDMHTPHMLKLSRRRLGQSECNDSKPQRTPSKGCSHRWRVVATRGFLTCVPFAKRFLAENAFHLLDHPRPHYSCHPILTIVLIVMIRVTIVLIVIHHHHQQLQHHNHDNSDDNTVIKWENINDHHQYQHHSV